MRLTLRTLLAYLDDILEPSQTKEIGNKLAESKFASDLVDRIREVMRRRRLTAPSLDGGDDSLDANVVAEYLDNTLPPEKVTDVEKQCLESDIHLAEVAASHQVLTLVLGEPVEIAPESRRRMYGLVSQGSGDNQAAVASETPLEAEDVEPDEIAVAAAAPQETERTETIGSALPDYLKPPPFWRRALTLTVAALLVLVLAGLIVTDPGNRKWLGFGDASATVANAPPEGGAPRQAETGESDRGKANASKEAASNSVAETLTPNEVGRAVGGPGVAREAERAREVPLGPGAQNPPGDRKSRSPVDAERDMALIAPRPMPAGSTSRHERNPDDRKANAGAGPKAAVESSAPMPPLEPPPEVRLASKTGVLLGYDGARDDWFVLERPGLTLPNPKDLPPDTVTLDPTAKAQVPRPPAPMNADRRADQLVAPEPFDNVLELGDGLCRISLLGGTSVRLLAPTSTTRFGIELREGRIVVRSGGSKLPGTEYRPLTIALKLGDEVSQLVFLRPETQCGIELVPGFPTKPGEDAKDTGFRGALYVVSGEVRFAEPAGRQRTLVGGRWISLAPQDRAAATDLAGAAFRPTGGTILSWLNPDSRRVLASQAKVTHDFQGEFLPDQPVSASIGTVAKNERNPKIAELAVKTLALTNQYSALVEVLSQVNHEEAVHAAANGLREWLPLAPDHAALLQKELATAFPPGPRTLGAELDDRGIVMRLLWGYNSDDARDRKTSNQLVEWLDHDRLAVRLLAIDQIRELTGRTLHYRPAMPTGDRKRLKKDWEHYVERYKGLLQQ